MCDHQYDQYHGVFTCRKCKEIIYDFSENCSWDKKETELREESKKKD